MTNTAPLAAAALEIFAVGAHIGSILRRSPRLSSARVETSAGVETPIGGHAIS